MIETGAAARHDRGATEANTSFRPEEDIELGPWNDRYAVMKGSQAAFASEPAAIVMRSPIGCGAAFISRKSETSGDRQNRCNFSGLPLIWVWEGLRIPFAQPPPLEQPERRGYH